MSERKLVSSVWEDATFMSQFEDLEEDEKKIVENYVNDLTSKIDSILNGFKKYTEDPDNIEKINEELKAILLSGKN